METWRVLCVDDKEDIAGNVRDILAEWVEGNPYESLVVDIETDFTRAIQRLKNEHFDLITLDLHGVADPEPIRDDGEQGEQEGAKVLEVLRQARFVPVIFYTGYAEKIRSFETGIVKVVKKGENDVDSLRAAASAIYETGLPKLLRQIDEEKRFFMWETVDKHWSEVRDHGTPEDLAYLLARRLAAKLNRESVKELLGHAIGAARPIEMYIFPPISDSVRTGCILKKNAEQIFWVIATPACDFAQSKVDHVLLIGATELDKHDRFIEWAKVKWDGNGAAPTNAARTAYERLLALFRNNAGDRYWFLPGTFFIPDLVIDFQKIRQVKADDVVLDDALCRLDSPYREEFILQVSRYYGRMGIPNIESSAIISRLTALA